MSFLSYIATRLARKARGKLFSGNERLNRSSWNESTQHAVTVLKSGPQAVKNADKSYIEHTPTNPEDSISLVLDSADDGAKMIVS